MTQPLDFLGVPFLKQTTRYFHRMFIKTMYGCPCDMISVRLFVGVGCVPCNSCQLCITLKNYRLDMVAENIITFVYLANRQQQPSMKFFSIYKRSHPSVITPTFLPRNWPN